MKILQDPLFQALFNSPVPRIIVHADAPVFTIVISNDAHKVVTNLVGKDISGKSVWETFDPTEAGGDGGKLLSDALTEAQMINTTVLMPPFRYDMGAPDGNGMVEKWWQLEIMPIGTEPITPAFLLVTTNDISERIFKERNIEAVQATLTEINYSLEEQVAIRTKELQTAYEQVALSKQAAQLGTFDMDLIKGTMEWDKRCRELFGVSHNDEVSYEQDFLTGLHPDDRERVEKLIAKLFDPSQSNGDYDVEYRTVGVADGRLRWVRAKGKLYFNDGGVAQRFIGSVLDVTDRKNEEQLRNSFISMASHELKTPLTSLQGYLQILKAKAVDQGNDFLRQALQYVAVREWQI
jgi:PAS domain S-box-containing protein